MEGNLGAAASNWAKFESTVAICVIAIDVDGLKFDAFFAPVCVCALGNNKEISGISQQL